MGSKGRFPPPSHLRRPLPGPEMLHPDPFGPGGRPPPGAFPFDMLPHPEILEQKFAAQDVEMQKLLRENQRLASTHLVLRQELAAAQQEMQRLHTHMGAMKDEEEHHMRGLHDKMAKMEADLKASENIKAELQQGHAEAQSLDGVRKELMAKVQQLTQDLQRSHADLQQVPALMSEVDNLRQDYQHCRGTYDQERKLRIDHYQSLQVMEKNYMSMLREVEKLRAELTNAANYDKSGRMYSNTGGYKENEIAGQRSVVQNAYEDAHGVSQERGPSSAAVAAYGGASAGTAPTHPGYEAQARVGLVYDGSRNSGYDASRVATGLDNSRGGSFEPPKGAATGYDAGNKGTGGAQVTTVIGNVPAPYGSAQTASPYGSAQVPSPHAAAQVPSPHNSAQALTTHGSSQAPNPYGFASQGPNPYGSASQGPNPYGSAAQAANSYGSAAQAANSYGSAAQAPNPYGSAAQAPNPYGSAQAPNPYGSAAQAPNPYGSAQAPNPYGSAAQALNPYGSAQALNQYGSAQAPNPYGSAQAPNTHRGGGSGASSRR